MHHYPCFVGISLLKIASLSLSVSRLALMMIGSYFIIRRLELQGVKAICVDRASWTIWPTSPRTQNQSPCQPEGLFCVGHLEWSNVWGLV